MNAVGERHDAEHPVPAEHADERLLADAIKPDRCDRRTGGTVGCPSAGTAQIGDQHVSRSLFHFLRTDTPRTPAALTPADRLSAGPQTGSQPKCHNHVTETD
jgi:hypothetical protein